MLDRWLASKVVIIAVGLVALFTSHTIAEEPILNRCLRMFKRRSNKSVNLVARSARLPWLKAMTD